MAQIVLTAAANTAAKRFGFSQAASLALRTGGQLVGQAIDNAIFGSNEVVASGSRLDNLAIQTSTYGEMIPIIYGISRAAGNIIWSRPIEESITVSNQGGGKGGGSTVATETYSYSVSLAIAICEGEIDDIVRVWADAEMIDPSLGEYRLYKGTETQEPDPFIESFEGIDKTPAYRGLAYVVIEDFPLADYGNRIPNFSFEVVRKIRMPDSSDAVEDQVTGMVMIPGSGEFVYDTIIQQKQLGTEISGTWVQQGEATDVNQNNRDNVADALVSLNQLELTCPNVSWISVVVGWFGDDMDAGVCTIRPGVEFDSINTTPDTWGVAGFDRASAYQISKDDDGNPVYGGTISDVSLLRYLDELKSRGYSIMFYPLFFMDTANKPWRGRVTGTAAEVADFFTRTNGYNAYINHYADLVKDKVDAFIIGSELIGLTSVQDTDNSFPAVDALVALAASVKTTVGASVKVSYAADWSEYHHTTGGWYHLDPLWSSSSIDFIGIDAYFPLTDIPQDKTYDKQTLIDAWTSGEGYEWIYTNAARTMKATLEDRYAWKNISWWWNNNHVNPDLNTTAWVPQSKKIWFTEYGFPSVDGAANQPNVFYDPNSSESAFPYHSQGIIDFKAQRVAIAATEEKWNDSIMIEQMFLWTWDARPYPFWPQLKDIWSDYQLWDYGHWVQGKISVSGLAAVIADLCEKAGLEDSEYDVSHINELLDGFVLNNQTTIKDTLETLQLAYFFDVVETDGVVHFIERGTTETQATITEDELLPKDSEQNIFEVNRDHDINLPQKIDVNYISFLRNFQTGNQHAQRLVTNARDQKRLNFPIVMSDQKAKNIADITLYNRWIERDTYYFHVGAEYITLDPGDIIDVIVNNITHTVRITDIQMTAINRYEIEAIAEDKIIYDSNTIAASTEQEASNITISSIPKTELELLDIPSLPNDDVNQPYIRFAATGLASGWRGSVVYRSDDNEVSYNQALLIDSLSVIGTVINEVASGTLNIFDHETTIEVILRSGLLESSTEFSVLNGSNIALIGNEIIQFMTATMIEENRYILSSLLRGRFNTEEYISTHVAGERFVLLDNMVSKEIMSLANQGQSKFYKPVTIGATLGSTASQEFMWNAINLKPYSPVHIIGSRDSSHNLTIQWVRRTRINGQLRDFVDVALDEFSEVYEIDILNGSEVIRTLIATDTTVEYSAASQISDFGSTQSEVSIEVYQISELIGRGKKAYACV